jgi:hypothetical protein
MHPRCPQFGSEPLAADVYVPDAPPVVTKHPMGFKPFRGSLAVADCKLTADDLRSGAFRRLFKDVYVDARVPDSQRLVIQAAALRLPADAVVTGRSAAYLWDATLGSPGDAIEVLSPTRISVAGIRARTGRIAPSEVTTRYGVRVPTLLHTTWELARALPALEAVPWIDRLAHDRRLETDALLAHHSAHIGEWGSARAGATLAMCDPRAESPPESIVRISLALGGVPAPIPQWEVRTRSGLLIARVDFAWPDLCLALEYDGQWHADRNQLARDRERIRNLNAAGWYVYPITRNDLRDMDGLVESIKRLLAKRSRLLSRTWATNQT